MEQICRLTLTAGRNVVARCHRSHLDDVPHVLGCVTEFAACHASTQAIVADADGVVLEAVCEVISAFCHGSDKDANTFLGSQVRDVVPYTYHFGVEAQCNLSTIGWKVSGDWVLDDLE